MGKMLDSSQMAEEFCARVARLREDQPARWGRMSAGQMVRHLLDSFQAVSGERYVSPKMNWFSRYVMRWGALHTPIPWPKGVPTRPEIAQDHLGSTPGEWSSDVAALAERLRTFPRQTRFDSHPIFGEMELAEWRIWAYRHCDHHFRQFGI